MKNSENTTAIIDGISSESWHSELEQISARYLDIACWIAAILNPVFAFTDYLNIPESWYSIFVVRLGVSAITVIAVLLRKRLNLTPTAVVSVPFVLISLQNSYVYLFVGADHVLAQHLNYMALIVGAAMFVLWRWTYSILITVVSMISTGIFFYFNPRLTIDQFFLNGGLLLAASTVFMIVLINARYNLTVREIKARIALANSISILQSQQEEIKSINENLERLVRDRTSELEAKNRAIEEYAFLTAHKLRGPVASVLGLTAVFRSIPMTDEAAEAIKHLELSTHKLDEIVKSMIRAIESGETRVSRR